MFTATSVTMGAHRIERASLFARVTDLVESSESALSGKQTLVANARAYLNRDECFDDLRSKAHRSYWARKKERAQLIQALGMMGEGVAQERVLDAFLRSFGRFLAGEGTT